MPDGHRRAMPQVTAVDELFGTHNHHSGHSHPPRHHPTHVSNAETDSAD
jgi:hypothetical protein